MKFVAKKKIYFIFNYFFENCAVYDIIWKDIVERSRPQMTIWRRRLACWITNVTNTLRICNAYCFSTAPIVARTRLSVTLYVHCLSYL